MKRVMKKCMTLLMQATPSRVLMYKSTRKKVRNGENANGRLSKLRMIGRPGIEKLVLLSRTKAMLQ